MACLQAGLESLNAFLAPRAVRRYQRDILQDGRFSLPSPWTGEAIEPVDCLIANKSPLGFGDLVIAYRFRCRGTLWLVSGIVKDGFPIHEVYCPELGESLWELQPGLAAQNDIIRAQLGPLSDPMGGSPLEGFPLEGSPIEGAPRPPPVLLQGHPNFAHNMWNELAGLAALETLGPRFRVGARVASLCQPIQSFEALFGGLGLPCRPVRELGEVLGRRRALYTRVGATQLSRRFRERLRGAIRRGRDRRATGASERLLANCSPVVWLSVRLDARTPLNQEAFLTTLVRQVVARYPRAGFVLDGFAFPDDFDNPIYRSGSDARVDLAHLGVPCGELGNLRQWLAYRERDITRYIAHFGRELFHRVGRPMVSASGLTLTNAIYLAGLADYYVCHAGTLQHKIGWVHNTPGIVHSNTEGVQGFAARWMARQLEGGRAPSLLAPTLVYNRDSIRAINRVERNRDYTIADIDGAVTQVLEDMGRQLPCVHGPGSDRGPRNLSAV